MNTIGPPIGASASVRPAGRDNEVKLRKAAEDFTTVALNEMLKPMFDTTEASGEGPGDETFGGGAGERAFKPMMINEVAKGIARSGGLGLAEPVYQQMLRLQEGRR
jgi:Rod binding domain-containing protein